MLINIALYGILVYMPFLNVIRARQIHHVTCGSALKLMNVHHKVRLHSHDVKYGSGSGQQSVTAVETPDDHNSYWRIRGKMGDDCTRGEAVVCGNTIRLTHLETGKNLHSHHFQSPLSHNQEVSAFGEEGAGDDGDNWVVVCPAGEKYWRRDDKIRLKHVVTNTFLHVTGDSYGRPIYGQREVSTHPSTSELNFWKAHEGMFIKPTEPLQGTHSHDPSEL